MSATHEALSRSMADFDPEQGRRRARTQRSKRDLNMGCSAFHYVLSKDEMEEQKKKTKYGAEAHDRATGAGSKPFYSDLIMDVTFKSQSGPEIASPIFVAEEGEFDLRHAMSTAVIDSHRRKGSLPITVESNARNGNSKTISSKESSGRRPSRSIPSSNEINNPRTRGRLQRYNSSQSPCISTQNAQAPLTPEERARRTRNASEDRKSMCMSMVDFRRTLIRDRSVIDDWNPNDDCKSSGDYGEDKASTLAYTHARRRSSKKLSLDEFLSRKQVAKYDQTMVGETIASETQKLSPEECLKSPIAVTDGFALLALSSIQKTSRSKREPCVGSTGRQASASTPRLRCSNTHEGAVGPTRSINDPKTRRANSQRLLTQEHKSNKGPWMTKKERSLSKGSEAKKGRSFSRVLRTETSTSNVPGTPGHHRPDRHGPGGTQSSSQGPTVGPEKPRGGLHRSVSLGIPNKASGWVHRSVSRDDICVNRTSDILSADIEDGVNNRLGITRANVEDGDYNPSARQRHQVRRGSNPEAGNGTGGSPAIHRLLQRRRSSVDSTPRPTRDHSMATAAATRENTKDRLVECYTGAGIRLFTSGDGGRDMTPRRRLQQRSKSHNSSTSSFIHRSPIEPKGKQKRVIGIRAMSTSCLE
jgi:hypothetical protein